MSDTATTIELGPSTAELRGFLRSLARASPALDDVTRLDRIALLEQIKAAASAEQARETAAFKSSRIRERKAAEVRARDLERGIGAEVGLARRQSPYWGSRFVGLAEALVHEMPYTLEALTKGDVSEYRASLVVAETACLTRQHRSEVDALLKDRLGQWSDRQVQAEAKRIAYRLDPHAIVDRSRKAEADRRVTSWPAPDTMMNVCALLPVVQGAAVMAALTRAADAGRACGDARSRGQVMADTFVERLTGQTAADQTPIEVQLVMTERSLLSDDHTPAWLHGYGPVPAAYARLVLRNLDE